MTIGKHLIVTVEEWKTIINALDVFDFILQDKSIDDDLMDALKFHFQPNKVSNLSEKLCKVK
ncbi:MAG: hypothetical protein ACO24P_03690 [Candidatus Nanopelagicaceae bacterium]